MFCCQGGASMGLHRAWPDAEIVGVDINPQRRYPFTFIQADAMEYPLEGFDFIWASPPCQHFSALSEATGHKAKWPNLIDPIRQRLLITGKPFIIENVERAPLIQPIRLCGSMFPESLRVLRHRIFEPHGFTLEQMPCNHLGKVSDGFYVGHRDGGRVLPGRIRPPLWSQAQKAAAMGVEWMNSHGIRECIPPAYAEWCAHGLAR